MRKVLLKSIFNYVFIVSAWLFMYFTKSFTSIGALVMYGIFVFYTSYKWSKGLSDWFYKDREEGE